MIKDSTHREDIITFSKYEKRNIKLWRKTDKPNITVEFNTSLSIIDRLNREKVSENRQNNVTKRTFV